MSERCPEGLEEFERCEATWALVDLYPFMPYAVLHRLVASDGSFVQDEVDLAIRRYRNRKPMPLRSGEEQQA